VANPYSGTWGGTFDGDTFNDNVGALTGGTDDFWDMSGLISAEGPANNSGNHFNALNRSNWAIGCSALYKSNDNPNIRAYATLGRLSGYPWGGILTGMNSLVVANVDQYRRFYSQLGSNPNNLYAADVGVGSEIVDSWTTPGIASGSVMHIETCNDWSGVYDDGTLMADGTSSYADDDTLGYYGYGLYIQNYSNSASYYLDTLSVELWTEDTATAANKMYHYFQQGS
jgi:hypothetical protein